MKPLRHFLKFVVILFSLHVISSTLLGVCKNNGFVHSEGNERNVEPKNDLDFNNDWFHWGQLYSYCMQYDSATQNISSTFDKECATTKCQQCMTACQQDLPFNATSCSESCTTDECREGCLFYGSLKSGTASLHSENVPQVTSNQNVTVENRTFSNIQFQWNPVRSNGLPSLESLYLIVLKLDHGTGEFINVLGLITMTNFSLTIPQICSTFRFYKKYKENTKYKIILYPINYNGRSQDTLKSEYTSVKPASLANVNVGNPRYTLDFFGAPQISLYVNWTLPQDTMELAQVNNVFIERSLLNCKDDRSKELVLGTGLVLRLDETFGASLLIGDMPTWNTETDDLNSCTLQFEVQVHTGGCLRGDTKTIFYEYEGCTTVPNYTPTCPISTTPRPVDELVNFQFSVLNFTCESFENDTICIGDKRNYTCTKCLAYLYEIKVNWTKPMTATPIKYYNLRWGPRSTTFPQVIEPTTANSVEITDINQTMYIIDRSVSVEFEKELDFGIQLEAISSTPNFNTKRSWRIENYKFLMIKGPVNPPEPTNPPPKSSSFAPSTGEKDDETDKIIIGILIPLFLIVICVLILFIYYRRRNTGDNDIIHLNKNDIFDMYMDPQNGAVAVDDWEIFPTSITLDEKIGEGAFGTVFSANIHIDIVIKTKYAKQKGASNAILMEKNPKVAVKLLKEGASEMEYQDFKEEITLMKRIGFHKNIVNLIGCSTVKTPMCLIVEFMAGGDLLHYLRNRRSKLCAVTSDGTGAQSFMYTQNFQDSLQTSIEDSRSELVPDGRLASVSEDPNGLTPDDLVSFAWQISSGMEYLAANNLVHRDLAARNILVGEDRTVKISDFGLTRAVSSDLIYMSNKNRKLPIKWMSVEAIFDQVFTTYSDAWAYGIVLFEIVTLGGTPYPTINNRELLRLLKGGYRMEKPENCAEPMYDIMLHCWNEDPLQRPTFTELREHLENIMSQGDRYFTFEIDEENTYYNVASFKSIPSENEDDEIFEDELMDKPMQVKTIEDLKKEQEEKKHAIEKEEKLKLDDTDHIKPDNERYIQLNDMEKRDSMVEKVVTNPYVNTPIDRSVVL